MMEQLALWSDYWHDPHPYKYGGKWANECVCTNHWLDKIHKEDHSG